MTEPTLPSAGELRRRAEDRLGRMPGEPHQSLPFSLAETNQIRLIHELQVHQVELEMQNQSLLDAHAEISRHLDLFKDLYDLAPIAYFTLAREGNIVQTNALGRQLLGNPRLPIDRYRLAAFVGADSTATYNEFIERIFSRGTLEVCNVTLRCAAGQPPIYAFMEGIADEKRQECRLVVTDLSRQRETELALAALEVRTGELAEARDHAEAANRAKSTFLANMSHEIRTPMNAILGMAHLLRRGEVNPVQKEQLNKIDAAARHLLGVINDILDLSKIDAEGLVLEQAAFKLGQVLTNISDLIGEQARSKELQLTVSAEPRLLGMNLLGDALRLQQILLNLLANAVKFTAQGSVQVRARIKAESASTLCIEFEVEDSGCGIPAAALERIFAPFEQLDSSTTRQYAGTGLGLAIAKRLVHMMGGEIQVSSQLGVGSRFSFTAQFAKAASAPAANPAKAPLSAARAEWLLRNTYRQKRLLLAEDDPINQEVTLEILREDLGLHVDLAADGAQALALAGQTAYDLILMDMQMPVLDGLEATRAIRQLPGYASTPILAMTANAFSEDQQRCLAAGMNDYIAKPADPNQLFILLVRWLGRQED